MSRYIINSNAQPTGEHEVHEENNCNHLPSSENREFIGYFNNCFDAVRAAKVKWPRADIDGCAYCCSACHTR